MIDVIVVTVLESKNIHYISPNNFNVKKGDDVVFET